MLNVFLSILPIFLLIVTGYIIKNWFVRDERFWVVIEKLTYYLFFPSLLILKVSEADFSTSNSSTALITTIIATFVISGLIFLTRLVVTIPDDLFTSLFQGGIRYNSYIFIAISQSLYGGLGVALSGVFIAYMIVLTNVMSVIVLNHYGNGSKKAFSSVFKAVIQNPLIIGSLAGILLNVLNVRFSGAGKDFLAYLADPATPLSLLSVGAGLNLIMKWQKIMVAAYAGSLKLFVMPICTILLLKLFGSTGIAANIALVYSTIPCAGNSYTLARQMGGDSEAMASIITWSTLFSVITITLLLGIFHF